MTNPESRVGVGVNGALLSIVAGFSGYVGLSVAGERQQMRDEVNLLCYEAYNAEGNLSMCSDRVADFRLGIELNDLTREGDDYVARLPASEIQEHLEGQLPKEGSTRLNEGAPVLGGVLTAAGGLLTYLKLRQMSRPKAPESQNPHISW